MTFVHGPEGVTFPEEKPAKLRFFLGYVDELAPAEDGIGQASVCCFFSIHCRKLNIFQESLISLFRFYFRFAPYNV